MRWLHAFLAGARWHLNRVLQSDSVRKNTLMHRIVRLEQRARCVVHHVLVRELILLQRR